MKANPTLIRKYVGPYSGVAIGWIEVDTSTPLLPEGVLGIDADRVSFYRR